MMTRVSSPFGSRRMLAMSAVLMCGGFAWANPAPDTDVDRPARVTLQPAVDRAVLPPCRSECRVARQTCRLDCVDRLTERRNEAEFRPALEACVAECEEIGLTCRRVCDGEEQPENIPGE